MIELLIKVTLVLLAGGLAALLLHRRSAALRHLVWTVTLASAVGLALASGVTPELPVRVAGVVNTFPLGNPGDRTVFNSPGSSLPETEGVPVTTIRRSTADWLGLTWVAGVLVILGWCSLGRLGLSLLLRRATPLIEVEWLQALGLARGQAGVTRPVRLFVSRVVGSPATWGLFRPVIVLPIDAASWSEARRRVVLAHELAHVARGDGLALLIGWAAGALYWFHPLAWVAARRLRIEAERAADDHVLARGVPPVDYAAHLLDVARGSRAMRLLGASAIGMARPSHLEGRLLAVLDETRDRIAPPSPARRAAWMGAAAVIFPLAALTPVLDTTPPGVPEPRHDRGFAQGDSTFEQSHPARPGEQLSLDLETGGSVHITGWDEPTVRIRGTLGGQNWRETAVEIERRPPGLRLHAYATARRSSFSTRHHFEIRVPRRYDVHIESGGGSLTIIGIDGSFTGNTGGGDLTIERAKGRATLSIGGGDISVTDSELDGRVSTGGGMVRLDRVSGGLRGSSGSGPVMRVGDREDEKGDLSGVTVDRHDRIRVSNEPGKASGMLHIEKAGGDVDLERAPDGADIRTGGGGVRIGGGAGRIRAKTGGGDVTIGPVDGSIEASSGAGTLRATIVNEDGSVELSTGNGAAIVNLPSGFSGRFELETAYTRGHSRTRISSDWDLPQTETDEWDSTYGSPRKYVRATGRVGNGRGVIRITIVNGDITIRRGR